MQVWNQPELAGQLGTNARKDYEAKYMPEDNYGQLIDI